jgi:ribonucleoside-triphosphate reductase
MYKIFNENPELYKLFIDVVRQRGQFYFLNSYKTDRTGLFSMCCRLTIDLNKVKKFLHEAKGIWSIPASTGSIGYVSINLPRLALLCLRYGYDEKRIFDMIMDLAYIARDVLLILRQRYQKLFKAGLYPLTREYVDKIDPFKYYFNTIAIVGIAEFVQILVQDEKLWTSEIDIDGRSKVNEIIRIEREILEFLNRLLTEFEKEDNILYNIEQAPAESASTKFALLDYREFPEYRKLIPRQTIPVKNVNSCSIEFREVPFYTSQNTPPYTTYRLSTQLYIEEQIQRLYTGGVIKHIFTHNPLPKESIIKIVEEIPKTYDLVYFTYSPTQSICLNCGYRDVKLFEQCPKCGSTNVENWSRIVGYYRPVQNWNIGKIAEFYSRKLTDF